jgi:hypothetical protein
MEIACDDVQARTASARAPTLWLEPKRGGAGFDHQTVIDLILVNPGFCLSFLTSCAFFFIFIRSWEREGKHSRAACWLVFTRQFSKAIELLMRSKGNPIPSRRLQR